MNDFIETLLSRRSVRNFTNEPVTDEELTTLLRAGMAAPSAVNVQPWSFLVVKERERLERLAVALPYASMTAAAGAAIIVCGLPEKDGQYAGRYWTYDCSAATENILLAAHSLGLGAVWTAVYPETDRVDAVRKECRIPGDIIPMNVIPVGRPRSPDGKAQDKFTEANIHYETWD